MKRSEYNSNQWEFTDIGTRKYGRINAYYHMQRLILERDTNGDFTPNEYLIFELTERDDIHKMLDQMLSRLGVKNL